MKPEFKLEDGRIVLEIYQMVWGDEMLVYREDVTDKVMPVVADHLDEALGFADFKGRKTKTIGG